MFTDVNPLTIPMMCGWSREVTHVLRRQNIVYYKGPCGRRMRNMEDLHRYLCLTDCRLSIDLFCFQTVRCFIEFQPKVICSHLPGIF